MYFKPYYLGCLAHASYLIGGDNGEAAVIDPRRDVDEYIADAEAAGLQIKHVIESHLHADFVSGHVELARRTGAKIWLGPAKGVGFGHRTALEDDEIEMGDVKLRFLETPGHTLEGVTVLVDVGGERRPRMAFTGDTIEPEIAKPSSPANEKSPSWTAGGGENTRAADPPHETLTSVLFRIVNRISVS